MDPFARRETKRSIEKARRVGTRCGGAKDDNQQSNALFRLGDLPKRRSECMYIMSEKIKR